ncbi:bifunctional hydroxymethylpyrimidine kinase/phosphomethylpyrimidine kinase [Sphingomonas sp.]|uniref:bifunctional hydroxymethylpyrimidine kinase/phosphomethylpyrimidine kinase n=1 Tax=Sphingomonas sp. TaxID=28214 RepID=UPI002ED8EB6C
MTFPRILIVAGSDSGGGAGIQADIKTVTMLGAHAMNAITAITAQNTIGVQAVHAIHTEIVVAQMRSCIDDIGVDAIKIGMIGSAETAHAVADVLEELSPSPLRGEGAERSDGGRGAERDAAWSTLPLSPALSPQAGRGRVPIVFDPVMVATSGAILADDATIAAFARLMALATVVTPNLPELAALGGEAAVLAHAAALLVKGGHGEGAVLTDRLLDRSGQVVRWESPRIDTTSTHGTGCTLASAIATNLARGLTLPTAIANARRFVRTAMHDAAGLGAGHGPMAQQAVRLDLGDGPRLNQMTLPLQDYGASVAFYKMLGLRQIVATADGHYARFEAAGGATLSIGHAERASVYLEHEDLDAAVAAAQAAGIGFDEPPQDKPWLWREAWTRDPAGNPVCLYQAGENRRFPPWRV